MHLAELPLPVTFSPLPPTPAADARQAPDHLVVRVAAERFALPLAAVDEALDAPAVLAIPGAAGDCLGVVSWRERRVPLFRPDRATGVRLGHAAAALVFAGARPFALAVDEVHDAVAVADGDVRPLPGLADPHGVLRGVARTGDGLLAVLDAAAVTALFAATGDLGDAS